MSESSKKISRKSISRMSFREFMRASQAPYLRLASYLKPYKVRFTLGLIFGALYGAANGLFVYVIKNAGNVVLGHKGDFFSGTTGATGQHAALVQVVLICLSIPGVM